MRPYKKPKYKLDIKKLTAAAESKRKKDEDWTPAELYKEQLRSKSRYRKR